MHPVSEQFPGGWEKGLSWFKRCNFDASYQRRKNVSVDSKDASWMHHIKGEQKLSFQTCILPAFPKTWAGCVGWYKRAIILSSYHPRDGQGMAKEESCHSPDDVVENFHEVSNASWSTTLGTNNLVFLLHVPWFLMDLICICLET